MKLDDGQGYLYSNERWNYSNSHLMGISAKKLKLRLFFTYTLTVVISVLLVIVVDYVVTNRVESIRLMSCLCVPMIFVPLFVVFRDTLITSGELDRRKQRALKLLENDTTYDSMIT